MTEKGKDAPRSTYDLKDVIAIIGAAVQIVLPALTTAIIAFMVAFLFIKVWL